MYDASRIAFKLWSCEDKEPYHYFSLAAWANRVDTTCRLAIDEIKDGDTVLDIGTGVGFIPLAIAMNRDIAVKCLDVSSTPTLKQMVGYFPVKDKFTFIKGDICDIKEKADWVLCTEVLEHIDNDKLAVENLYKAANKGVIISTPNELSNQQVVGHMRTYTLADMRNLIETVSNDYELWRDNNLFHCNLAIVRKK